MTNANCKSLSAAQLTSTRASSVHNAGSREQGVSSPSRRDSGRFCRNGGHYGRDGKQHNRGRAHPRHGLNTEQYARGRHGLIRRMSEKNTLQSKNTFRLSLQGGGTVEYPNQSVYTMPQSRRN